MKTAPVALVLSLAAWGCGQHEFDRTEMIARLRQDEPLFTDQDVLKIEQLKPQLPPKFRLAVAPPASWRSEPSSDEELRQIEAWAEGLQQAGVVSECFLLPSMLLERRSESHPKEYLKSIRVAAARCRADAVLLLGTVTDVERSVNPMSLFDLTIIGAWLVPGHEREALTITEGVLFDNRNEYVYLTAVAEGRGGTVASFVHARDEVAIRRSRAQSFQAFGEKFLRKAKELGPARK